MTNSPPLIYSFAMDGDDIEREKMQRSLCVEMKADYTAAPPEWVSGFASQAKGRTPLNGLRHPAAPGTTGWYLWCGEDSSEAKDFYQPLHTKHLYEYFPLAAKLLGLPPGYRFLLAGEYLDVWFDPKLTEGERDVE
jgi:hypothetical protein